jgi:hypothetical protein
MSAVNLVRSRSGAWLVCWVEGDTDCCERFARYHDAAALARLLGRA